LPSPARTVLHRVHVFVEDGLLLERAVVVDVEEGLVARVIGKKTAAHLQVVRRLGPGVAQPQPDVLLVRDRFGGAQGRGERLPVGLDDQRVARVSTSACRCFSSPAGVSRTFA
jgi:hypothetical protein